MATNPNNLLTRLLIRYFYTSRELYSLMRRKQVALNDKELDRQINQMQADVWLMADEIHSNLNEEIPQAITEIKAKYENPDSYIRTGNDTDLVRYKIRMLDGSTFHAVMTNKQRDFLFKNSFSIFIDNTGGEGYQNKKQEQG